MRYERALLLLARDFYIFFAPRTRIYIYIYVYTGGGILHAANIVQRHPPHRRLKTHLSGPIFVAPAAAAVPCADRERVIRVYTINVQYIYTYIHYVYIRFF